MTVGIIPPGDDGPDDERWLALALVAAFTTFLRIARKRLGLKHGERCPRCGHQYILVGLVVLSGLLLISG